MQIFPNIFIRYIREVFTVNVNDGESSFRNSLLGRPPTFTASRELDPDSVSGKHTCHIRATVVSHGNRFSSLRARSCLSSHLLEQRGTSFLQQIPKFATMTLTPIQRKYSLLSTGTKKRIVPHTNSPSSTPTFHIQYNTLSHYLLRALRLVRQFQPIRIAARKERRKPLH